MLTINKPAHYGYRSVHDLPTPPSTSRPSPPLIFQEPRKPLSAVPRTSSPPNQPMSAPHRGLPPPVAMTLAQAQHQSSGPPPPLPPPQSGTSLGQAPPPPGPQQGHAYAQFPPPPSWNVSEESMRAYLAAKAEEDRRRQEEEKTQQENLRLQQRRLELDILNVSLQGGIPPPMVPVVFAGMAGGALPQAALEWAQQYVYSHSQQPHQPALLPPGPISASPRRRDSQAPAYSAYPGSAGVPSTPGSAQGPSSGYIPAYSGSPNRPRGQSMPGAWATRHQHGSGSLPSLNTSFQGRPGGDGPPQHPGAPTAQQQEAQNSPSIYFHYWQPPAGQAGGRGSGTDQPGTPSGESPKKRKATGPQQQPPAPSNPFQSAALSNPPPGRRRGHSRQRSDIGTYRASGRGRGESFGPSVSSLTYTSGLASTHEAGGEPSSSSSQQTQAQPQTQRSGAHTVSSLLADNPPSPQPAQYPHMGAHRGEGARRGSPGLPEERVRGAKHEREDND